jgi:hypothetical protein
MENETLDLIYKRRNVMVAEIRTQQVANNSFFLDPRVKCVQAQDSVEEFGAPLHEALSRQTVAAA